MEELYTDKLIEQLRGRLKEAYEAVTKYSRDGNIIGKVTRFEYINVGSKPLIKVDISFESYFKNPVKRGEIIAIASIIPKVIVIGSVDTITRGDMMTALGIKEIRGREDPSTIITNTVLTINPLAEVNLEDLEKGTPKPTPVISPIDPQSPVFLPKDDLIEIALNMPKEGVTIGNVFSGFKKISARVILDEETLRHHVLIIGTTGSGKTTLLKSIIYDNGIPKQSVVFDRQGDFVRFALEKGLEGSVVVPITKQLVEQYKTFEEMIRSRYCEDAISEVDYVTCEKVRFYPFSLKFSNVFKNFNNISPYMSEQASMMWEAIYNRFKGDLYESLKELIVGKNAKQLTNESKQIIDSLWGWILNNITLSNLVDEPLYLKGGLLRQVNEVVKTSNNQKDKYIIIKKSNENSDSPVFYLYTLLKYVMDKELDLHSSTKSNINRLMRSLKDFGIFDVENTIHELPEEILNSELLIIDLSFLLESTESTDPISIVVYEILNEIYSFKDKWYKRNPKRTFLTLLIIDEAHEFFPQAKGEVSKSTIERMINRILRLGRVRGLGAILATHMPQDLNELILQLTNTKIIMRNNKDVLEDMGAKDYADILTSAPPGLALVKSIRFNDILMQTNPP
ncbi:ATP-binding protein [Stygiolobus azoricus]|nr:ATP-binding protein [Stygiolobus azoricus]